MDFPTPLVRGRLIQRYKRFLADVLLEDGTELTAHCPNPGSMLGLNMPGSPVWLSKSSDPKRKLAYTLELIEVEGSIPGDFVKVGLNTMHPNRLVAEALAADHFPELTGYAAHRREVRYGTRSRVDFLLEAPDRPPCWLEVKNCHLMRTPGLAEFPDCVAARSTRHLGELEAMVAQGDRAAVLFVVQRTDCHRFAPARDCDPAFASALKRVQANGVEVYVYACEIDVTGVRVAARIA